MQKVEIEALIRLVDDEDEGIYQHVRTQLLQQGQHAFHVLQEYALRADNELQHERLQEIVGQIHLNSIKEGFKEWIASNPNDLLNGFYLISKYRFPDLEKEPLISSIDKIKLDIWLRLNYKFSPLDNVRIINEVFFGKYRFHGDQKEQDAPDNFFLNQVIEYRKGSPIALSILYSIIAQRLHLPVFGVNLPDHFILAYKDDSELDDEESFNTEENLPYDLPGDVLFYVNAFNGGAIFSKFNIDRFLKQSGLPNNEKYFEPCSNPHIILRMMTQLIESYKRRNKTLRTKELKELYSFVSDLIE